MNRKVDVEVLLLRYHSESTKTETTHIWSVKRKIDFAQDRTGDVLRVKQMP